MQTDGTSLRGSPGFGNSARSERSLRASQVPFKPDEQGNGACSAQPEDGDVTPRRFSTSNRWTSQHWRIVSREPSKSSPTWPSEGGAATLDGPRRPPSAGVHRTASALRARPAAEARQSAPIRARAARERSVRHTGHWLVLHGLRSMAHGLPPWARPGLSRASFIDGAASRAVSRHRGRHRCTSSCRHRGPGGSPGRRSSAARPRRQPQAPKLHYASTATSARCPDSDPAGADDRARSTSRPRAQRSPRFATAPPAPGERARPGSGLGHSSCRFPNRPPSAPLAMAAASRADAASGLGSLARRGETVAAVAGARAAPSAPCSVRTHAEPPREPSPAPTPPSAFTGEREIPRNSVRRPIGERAIFPAG